MNNLPVTNKSKWSFLTYKESHYDYCYMTCFNEVIFGTCADNFYKHNYYDKHKLEGIEIRWNYNIFENE